MKNPKLSIIILSYNTKDLLRNCLLSLNKVRDEVNFEVIVSDNGSSDGSPEMVEKEFPWVKVIKIGKNIGFSAGNNRARPFAKGEYILFLNSDTIVKKNTLRIMIDYMERNRDIGAATCKIVLPNGNLDKDARRSFVTPWIGFVHLFLKLDRLFPRSKVFARYWYGFIDENEIHEIDALQGAFFLTRKKILDKVGWFDEAYFLDGEDIDLSYKIKKLGYKNMYYPKAEIIHLKGATKGKIESQETAKVSLREKLKFRMAGVNSMEIFYRKHLWEKYPLLLNRMVVAGIKGIKIFRFMRTILFG